MKRRKNKTWTRWTPERDARFRELYPVLGARGTAQALGCTTNAVWVRRNKLGVRRRRSWTNERLAYLRENYGTMPTDIIAKTLGVSQASVHIAANRHGIRKLMRRTNSLVKARWAPEPKPKPAAKPELKLTVEPRREKISKVKTWDETTEDRHRRHYERAREIERLLTADPDRPEAIALVDEYNALARKLTGFSVPERYRL